MKNPREALSLAQLQPAEQVFMTGSSSSSHCWDKRSNAQRKGWVPTVAVHHGTGESKTKQNKKATMGVKSRKEDIKIKSYA